MIVGLSVHGQSLDALRLFDSMKVEPDHITFVGVLTACSRSGLVYEGRSYFNSMTEDYKIVPGVKHYGCMIDMLCRHGYADQGEFRALEDGHGCMQSARAV